MGMQRELMGKLGCERMEGWCTPDVHDPIQQQNSTAIRHRGGGSILFFRSLIHMSPQYIARVFLCPTQKNHLKGFRLSHWRRLGMIRPLDAATPARRPIGPITLYVGLHQETLVGKIGRRNPCWVNPGSTRVGLFNSYVGFYRCLTALTYS
jgi:hypothetical protein